jgi:hypothetical protein
VIFQGVDWPRLMLVFFSQGFMAIAFVVLAFKIVRRKRDRSTVALSLFYFILAIGLILNIVFVLFTPTNNELLLRTLYVLSAFFIAFSFAFNLVFINVILKLKDEFTIKKMAVIIGACGIIILLLYLIPEGVTFDSNWVPTYSLPFVVLVYVFFTLYITVPTSYYSARLYKLFKARNLKDRFRLYLIGITILLATVYGGTFFIATYNQLFRLIYSVFAFFLEIAAGLLVYYGLGKDL